MDRRFEDEMLEAAFGDMTPEEAEAIAREAANDPETAKLFAEYRDMRDGLQSLREVPPHQLSTERLRHAILQQGLKPKRSGWNLGWLIAPATAAAAVFMGFVLMNTQQPTQSSSLAEHRTENPLVSEVREDVASDATRFSEAFGPSIPREWTSMAVDTDEPVAIDRQPVRRKIRTGGQGKWRSGDGRAGGLTVVASNEMYGPVAPGAPEAPAPMADLAGNGSGIVVIESERGEMGANRATEVDSARNVVIGG